MVELNKQSIETLEMLQKRFKKEKEFCGETIIDKLADVAVYYFLKDIYKETDEQFSGLNPVMSLVWEYDEYSDEIIEEYTMRLLEEWNES